jgi:hypothetical protein
MHPRVLLGLHGPPRRRQVLSAYCARSARLQFRAASYARGARWGERMLGAPLERVAVCPGQRPTSCVVGCWRMTLILRSRRCAACSLLVYTSFLLGSRPQQSRVEVSP